MLILILMTAAVMSMLSLLIIKVVTVDLPVLAGSRERSILRCSFVSGLDCSRLVSVIIFRLVLLLLDLTCGVIMNARWFRVVLLWMWVYVCLI